MTVKVCVFDAYGTLFDVAAAARRCAAETGPEPWRAALAEKWTALAETWRLKQLQYTWLRGLSGDYVDFWTITGGSLDYALETHDFAGTAGADALRDRLLQLYFELDAFPEVPATLAALKAQGLGVAILSNGEPAMLAAAAKSAGVDQTLDAILSVESVKIFKPHRSVYDLVGERFNTAPGAVAFVSSNCWDACAGAGFGFRSIWVNRRSEPLDRLAAAPELVLSDLAELPARVASLPPR